MQPFPVICETCRARLKIRDASVIGEIHACPRCGGMVHIIPPPDWTGEAPSAPPQVPPVETPSAKAVMNETVREAAPAPSPAEAAPNPPTSPAAPAPSIQTPSIQSSSIHWPSAPMETPTEATPAELAPTIGEAAPPLPPADFGGVDLLNEPLTSHASAPSPRSSTEPAVPHLPDVATGSAPPAEVAPSPSLAARALAQPILLWGGIAAAVVFVCGFGTALWLTGDSQRQHVASQVAPPGQTTSPGAELDSLADTEGDDSLRPDEPSRSDGGALAEATSETPDAAPPSDEAAPVATNPGSTLAPAEHQVARPVADAANVAEPPASDEELLADQGALPALPPEQALPQPPAPPADSQASPASNVASSAVGAAGTASAPSSKPILRFDPLNFDPLALGLSTEPEGEPAPPKQSLADRVKVDPLPPPSDEHQRLPGEKELFEPEEDTTISVDRGPKAAVDLPPIDVEEQLALSIESIEMPSATLSTFLRSVSQLADVPITLEPAALQMAGVAADQKTKVRGRNTTLSALLRNTLKPHRLDFVARDGQIVIVRPTPGGRREVKYEIGDLASRPAEVSRLAQLLQRLVAPETWQAGGGAGSVSENATKLTVEQSPPVHYQVLIFLERLRRARELPPRSQYPVELLGVDSPHKRVTEALADTTTFTFLPWTPLAEVVDHWRLATGVTILVDWRSLGEGGLTPSSPVSCSAVDRRWDEALTAILGRLDLTWIAIDSGTIQITTEDAAERTRRIEFFAVAESFRDQFSSSDALIDTLTTELEQKFPPLIGTAPPELALDEPSGTLIVLAGASAQRYLAERLSGIVSDHVAGADRAQHRVSAQPLP